MKQGIDNIALSQTEMADELYRRYAGDGAAGSFFNRFRYYRKKIMWNTVIKGSFLLKRLVDIIVAGTALVVLSPLFMIVGICIKLTDGGSAIYWQPRVGRYGREFPFPKFRSMVVNADKM